MIVIRGLSPNAAYLRLLAIATQNDWPLEESRVGRCRDLGAVTVELDAGERTILLEARRWNPAFALVEAAWVVTGRNDVKTLANFIKNFDDYSDDGLTLRGAYGYRLRHFFNRDQIEIAINELIERPLSRRAVLSLYSADDLGLDSKDIPCNIQVALRQTQGRLDITVFNRSNDLWLGVPYNWFVFRMLQHMIADRLGVPCGIQRHVSSCLHLYEAKENDARRVVACNQQAELEREEMELAKLDTPGLLRDATALADQSFELLSSAQLTNFFDRYRSYLSGSAKHTKPPTAYDVLTRSLDLWNPRRPDKKNKASGRTVRPVIGRKIQSWVFHEPVSTIAERLSEIAQEATPMLREALNSEPGQESSISPKDAASEHQASLKFILELILGTLAPELIQTGAGDRLRDRLDIIATAAHLEPTKLREREARHGWLDNLFNTLPD